VDIVISNGVVTLGPGYFGGYGLKWGTSDQVFLVDCMMNAIEQPRYCPLITALLANNVHMIELLLKKHRWKLTTHVRDAMRDAVIHEDPVVTKYLLTHYNPGYQYKKYLIIRAANFAKVKQVQCIANSMDVMVSKELAVNIVKKIHNTDIMFLLGKSTSPEIKYFEL
jgi:hypothetical protein